MPKLKEKADTIQLLNVTILSVKFNRKVVGKIVGSAIAQFESGEKPKLLLDIAGKRYDFVLNSTNQGIIGDHLESMGLERDTDAIPEQSEIELEVYETGSTGQFEFGIRVNSLTFPK